LTIEIKSGYHQYESQYVLDAQETHSGTDGTMAPTDGLDGTDGRTIVVFQKWITGSNQRQQQEDAKRQPTVKWSVYEVSIQQSVDWYLGNFDEKPGKE
jgi:hypothetical protein